MSEPTIFCPNCKTEIKLTESLAAPLIESTRRDYEKRLALKDTDIARKEESLREREAAVSKATQAIDDQVAEKLLAGAREDCCRGIQEGQTSPPDRYRPEGTRTGRASGHSRSTRGQTRRGSESTGRSHSTKT